MTRDRVWTYGDSVAEVRARMCPRPISLRPDNSPESVFDILAGIAGGGVVVFPPNDIDGPAELEAHPDARLVVFTSGSTGSPKGARFTLANLSAAAAASKSHLGHGPEDVWLLALPLHHVGGLSILVRSAYAGGAVYLTDGFDPSVVAGLLKGEVSVASLVSTMLVRVLEVDPGPYRGLRAVLIGGGPIPDGLLERAFAAEIPVLPSYGMTETFGQVATLRSGSPPARRAHPLPGVELRIEPDGRIAVSGSQVSAGYIGQPDREDRWLVTNDLGIIDEEGAVVVIGRADDVVVTGGVNVDPSLAEEVLSRHPGAGDLVVIGGPHPLWGEALVCLYTGQAEASDLETYARARLSGEMVPKVWLGVREIPRTGLGKPDRSKARRVYLSSTGPQA
ncbi:MAG: AMP-binding protein [Actinobacteria bacterium]|nr:AMP-binding protein [Actinomycetota bacterium]